VFGVYSIYVFGSNWAYNYNYNYSFGCSSFMPRRQYRIMEDETTFEDYQNGIIADMQQRIEVAETTKEKMLAVLDETLCCVAVEKISKKQAWLVEWAIEMIDAPFMQPAAAGEPVEGGADEPAAESSDDEAAAAESDEAAGSGGRRR